MNRTRLILGAVVCIFVAILAIVFLAVGGRKEHITTTPPPSTEETQTEAEYSVMIPDVLPTYSETEPNGTTKPDGTTAVQVSVTAEPSDTTAVQTTKAAEKTTKAKKESSTYEYAYAGFNPSVAAVSSENWNLLLVNQNYILPDGYSVKTAKIADGSQSLDYRVVPYYDKMIAAAKADGISLIAVSGYRSYDRQRANFTRKINYYTGLGYSKAEATRLASKIVLMPGTSEHNAGLAMDFGTNGNTTLDENFGKTDAFKWLSAHAADYGFILRYAANTTDITKVSYEPWHWRYVGVETAKDIKAKGVTLEEYLGG